MLSAEVTGVGWCSQGLGVFCNTQTHTHSEGHNALKAAYTSLTEVRTHKLRIRMTVSYSVISLTHAYNEQYKTK